MKCLVSRSAALLCAALFSVQILLAIPALDRPFEVEQPDGTAITLRLIGDEWYQFHQTTDGFAVVRDDEGWWVYADLDDVGQYRASKFRVGDRSPQAARFLEETGPRLRESATIIRQKTDAKHRINMQSIIEFARDASGKRRTTNMKVPVILIEYTDLAETYNNASFDDMMNQSNYNGTGSFRDYYLEISYNDLDVTADVFGWYTAASTEATYGNSMGTAAASGLVREAVDAAQASSSVTWSDYDNDSDGDVDVVFVVHAGQGAECGGSGSGNRVWSHRWALVATSNHVNYGGKWINDYVIQPEISCFGTNQHIEVGVFCHEFGHALGLPDLYDTVSANGDSEGIGNWGLMAGGGWGGNGSTPDRPTHMCAWSKIENGWITPTVVGTNQTGVSIPQVETNATAFKLWSNGSAGQQYFLVENRQKTGFDADLPNSGLAIWHIDESKRVVNNTDNGDETHKLVDMEAADGAVHMDNEVNRGDAGDVFPGSTSNTTFDASSSPNSRDYVGGDTAVCVDNISASSSTMTADFCVTSGMGPNLLVRDCANDVGAEPDVPCNGNWVQSLDIWIDNNDDGIIDAPIQGAVNHLYIRNWNIGGPTTDAKIRCWYVNPSLGLTFPGSGTPIVDDVTSNVELTIPSMGSLSPSVSGAGYRVYFNWDIPAPPPNIDHYCIGCVIQNASDPQTSQVPLQENNLGQINYWALALKAGTSPAKRGKRAADETVFRTQVEVNNQLGKPGLFEVRVEELTDGFVVENEVTEYWLEPRQQEILVLDIIRQDAKHQDQGRVAINLYQMPDNILVGSLRHDLYIDNHPPAQVGCFGLGYVYELYGDSYPTYPDTTRVLSWCEPKTDVMGFSEQIRYYEVHGAATLDELNQPNERTLIARTKADVDPDTEGHQFILENDKDENQFYTVVPVDLARNVGPAAPVLKAMPAKIQATRTPVGRDELEDGLQ